MTNAERKEWVTCTIVAVALAMAGWYSTTIFAHSNRLSAIEVRDADQSRRLDQIEQKIDRILERLPRRNNEATSP